MPLVMPSSPHTMVGAIQIAFISSEPAPVQPVSAWVLFLSATSYWSETINGH